MGRISMENYMKPVPRYIFYDYTTEKYTTNEPTNDHDYDVFELEITERQKRFDKDPTSRENFKNTPSEVSKYKNVFGFGFEIYLYWNDYKSSLYNQYMKTGKTSIDLALNESL